MNDSIELEHCKKGLLWHFHITYLPHPLLSLLLFLEKFTLPGYVASITFCSNILPYSFHCFPRDYLGPDSSLYRNIKLLTRDQLLELLTYLPSEIIGMTSVYQSGKRINHLPV